VILQTRWLLAGIGAVATIDVLTAMTLLDVDQPIGVAANPNLFADPLPAMTGQAAAAWDALLPGWYVWTHYGVEAAMLFVAVAVGVRRASSAAGGFFSRRHQVCADDPRLWTIKPPPQTIDRV
jgi:hypothetical protein